EPGVSVIAFTLKYPIDNWGEHVTEIALDGTFNTNAVGYEVSAIMGEASGQGIPLGFFLHVSTDGTATPGAKEHMLGDYLKYFAKRCPNVRFTLLDKESSEIKAMCTAFPNTKHMCCFWHALTCVEEQLAENCPPPLYSPQEAHCVFDFIDPAWAPGV
ncbi:hypothetical protein BS47DRAFT_1273024, partial [Hydnum rufescens UP504]